MSLTHFRCDCCDKIFDIRMRKIVKCSYTCFDHKSHKEFVCNHHHIQLCEKCYLESQQNENTERKKKDR